MAVKCSTSGLRGFLILLYKGLLLRKRHYIVTGFEIIFPVLLASVPAIIISETNVRTPQGRGDTWVNETHYKPFNVLKPSPSSTYIYHVDLAYTPSNNYTEKIIQDAVGIWTKYNKVDIDVKAFDDAEQLEFYCVREYRDNRWNKLVVGIVFNNFSPRQGSPFPTVLDYSLRISGMSQSTSSGKYRFKNQLYYTNDYYDTYYFLSWQAAVDQSFIQTKASEKGTVLDYKINMQKFPYPGYKDYDGTSTIIILPIILSYCFIIFIINLVRRVIEEKFNGSKELMKMMGMTNYTYWISTFLNYFIVGAVAMLVISIVYKSPLKHSIVLLESSNFFIIFFTLLLFMASLILFSLAVTTFFNKAVFGIIVLVILYNIGTNLISTLIFGIGDGTPSTKFLFLSPWGKVGLCLFPTGALYAAFQYVAVYEVSGEGINWSNINSYDVIPDFSFSDVMLSQMLSILLYCLLIWYVDAVWPWQYGVPKPFYFLFTKSYWCGYKDVRSEDILLGSNSDTKHTDYFEDDPTGISPGVVISNLSKVFRTGFQTKQAVNDVSLNIYKGQITALLGHNGAGKTTTINILTGLYSPSGGSASINGWDIFKQTAKARKSLGVCPQHNVLFDTLTVEEHLKLYAALKGVEWGQLNSEANNILTLLHLMDKKRELSKNLSGGMKRKLSLGIAIIGGSKVLFLDEPTSGMDVEARRSVWDALLGLRYDRTIILTTHYMEEADILGDRIAIMAEGEIQCCGSPLFLKKKFGTGYHLHVVKNQSFNLDALLGVLKKYVPDAILESNYEREASFTLVSESNSSFGQLFEDIEHSKEIYGINSCGITVTTMEDVFLHVANMFDIKVKNQVNQESEESDVSELRDIYIQHNNEMKYQNCSHWHNQFIGLVMKRVHYSKRHWGIFITQLILPFVLLCILLYCINLAKYTGYSTLKTEPLKLDINEVYGKTDGFYSKDEESDLVEKYQSVLQQNGVSAKEVGDPEKYILDYAKILNNYIKKFIIGGSIDKKLINLTAWYNGLPVHSMPLSLASMDVAILKTVIPSGVISITNHPLPGMSYSSGDPEHTLEKILASVFIPLALAFVSGSFVLVPIHERATKAKLLQLMTGISAAFYWFAMFVWDFFISILVSIIFVIPFAIFANYAFFGSHSEAIGTALLMMILYGWASIPFSYIFTLIFQKPNTGFSVVNAICVVFGVALGSTMISLSPLASEDKYFKFFSWFFKIIPSFCLSSGFGNLFAISYKNAYCESITEKELEFNCDSRYVNPSSAIFKCCKELCGDKCFNQTYPITFERGGCAADILFLFGLGFLYFLLLLMFESSLMASLGRHISQNFNRLRKRIVNYDIAGDRIQDSDVVQEEERVRTNYSRLSVEEALVVTNLSKQFKGLKAVDNLTFGIHKTECFGLLGVNGAGKTTTFRMLTGDCYPDEGNAIINTVSVISDLKQFQSHIGYCPQFDALIDRLSARELITLFARLRGVSGHSLERTVNSLIKMTDLTQYADKPTVVYSGGNKRKLSIALALIGAPPLLLLDEPTAGVDPVSRRKIWKILSLARIHTKAAVILTTHSMEESEALCSRLAIMVNGRFRCLGSIQQLKTKFGQGYTLIIKMKKEELAIPTSMNAIKAYIDTNLPGAQLKDDHQGMLQYHVVDSTITLSYLFKFMDGMKDNYNLEDYIISDTSLEQIFLAFARSQRVVGS